MPSPTERKLKFNFALSNCLEIQATAKIGNLAKNRYVEKLKREIARGAYPVTLYKRRTTIIFGISGLVQIRHIILSYYTFGGGRGIRGEGCVLEMSQLKIMKVVSLIFHMPNLPIFIHTGRSYTPTPRVRSSLHSSRKNCSCNLYFPNY